ncbi:MAG: hypothetical protein J6568_04975 [Snodgrassella sp.]|nr:hypothetical protein [Snodgrassella sp.]
MSSNFFFACFTASSASSSASLVITLAISLLSFLPRASSVSRTVFLAAVSAVSFSIFWATFFSICLTAFSLIDAPAFLPAILVALAAKVVRISAAYPGTIIIMLRARNNEHAIELVNDNLFNLGVRIYTQNDQPSWY